MYYARVGGFSNSEAAVGKDLEHLRVVRKHVRLKFLDPAFARYSSQVLQKERADPASLMFVEYGKRDLRPTTRVILKHNIAADANQWFVAAFSQCRHQPHMMNEIQIGEPG